MLKHPRISPSNVLYFSVECLCNVPSLSHSLSRVFRVILLRKNIACVLQQRALAIKYVTKTNYFALFPVTCDSTCSGWSDWYEGSCSRSCDEGIILRNRNRTCVYDDCKSNEEITLPCNLKTCPGKYDLNKYRIFRRQIVYCK